MRKKTIIAQLKDRVQELSIENDNLQRKVDAFEKEVAELAEQITDKTPDCQVGAWCDDCKHIGYGKVKYLQRHKYGSSWVNEKSGRYCKKHLHNICGEFEMQTNREVNL